MNGNVKGEVPPNTKEELLKIPNGDTSHQKDRKKNQQKLAAQHPLDPSKAIECLVHLLDGNEHKFLVPVCEMF